ncbi:MAG: hypothetical protein AB7O31_13455 [Burkholderiales bacterium]
MTRTPVRPRFAFNLGVGASTAHFTIEAGAIVERVRKAITPHEQHRLRLARRWMQNFLERDAKLEMLDARLSAARIAFANAATACTVGSLHADAKVRVALATVDAARAELRSLIEGDADE